MRNSRRWKISVCALLLTLVAALLVWRALPSGTTVATQHGEAWHGNAGVRLAAGQAAVRFTFEEPPDKLPEAPMARLYEVIHPAVNITPDRKVEKAKIVFQVDPNRVPLATNDADGQPQRSIHNAGIQIFSERLGAWIDIETTVEGNKLVAEAPHFSVYRAVWLKVGEFVVNGITYTTTAAMHLVDMFWQTGLEFMRQLHRNMAGKFDESKFDCSKASKVYTVQVGKAATTEQRFGACVIEAGNERSTLLIKNGWAVVTQFTADTTTGVKPLTNNDLSLPGLLRNKLLAGGNSVFAPGLDTASFEIGPKAPDSFQVHGRMSWAHTIIEIELALIQAFFPGSRAAQLLSDSSDNLGCVVNGGQKLLGTPGKEIPPALAEIARACLVPLLVNTFGAGHELVATVAKTPMIVPQLIQLGVNSFFAAITSQDMMATTFTVQKAGQEFKWLQGAWVFDCAGLYSRLTIDEDNNGVIVDKNYDASNNEDQRVIEFHPISEGGKTLLVIDSSQYPDVRAGEKWLVEPTLRDEGLDIHDNSTGLVFYREGIEISSYC